MAAPKKTGPKRPKPEEKGRLVHLGILVVLFGILGTLIYVYYNQRKMQVSAIGGPVAILSNDAPGEAEGRLYKFDRFGFLWGKVPKRTYEFAKDTGAYSNIEPEDYLGSEKCATCHKENYEAWSKHPHRFMNAKATSDRVMGDFSGRAVFSYLGGQGRFWREGDNYLMSAERGSVRRRWIIHRTIGSRYFQYYVGVQTAGPEPTGDERYTTDHVLPFGFWLTKQQWVPTVHINDTRTESGDDPKHNPYEDFYFAGYDRSCSQCHTTLPMSEWLLRSPDVVGKYTPYLMTMGLSDYLLKQRQLPEAKTPDKLNNEQVNEVMKALVENKLEARIWRLGIECESCHNGAREHAAHPEQVPPHFFPTSPFLQAKLPEKNPHGRTHENLNWTCARCHTGNRPEFPGQINTWNSVEFSDAARGSCYSKLECVNCHNPHKPTGLAWTQTPEQDDASCLKCHDKYKETLARKSHTHHAAGSEGDRCMNCHMPKINEGMDQLVRTHTIHSPTKRELIEQNGPNACNLCHLDKPIDWTLANLKDWYGKTYEKSMIARYYPERESSVGHGWLHHEFQATRLVAAATYGLQKRKESLPDLVSILDDSFLLNRQFGQMAVENVAGVELEKLGYRFTMSPEERKPVLPRVHAGRGITPK